MAMPAWAYYYQQVFNDKTLNIDPTAKFLAPASMQNEILFDYNQVNQSEEPVTIEGGDEGIGKGNEYIDIPISDGNEKVVTESKKYEDPLTPKEQPKNQPQPSKDQLNKDTSSKRKNSFIKRIFGKKSKDN